jgi:hypothetical protein
LLNQAVEGLRASGSNDDLPRGLLARAAFCRSVGDWDGAARDLDEVLARLRGFACGKAGFAIFLSVQVTDLY